MRYLGLDLGTTSVSAAVIDLQTGEVLTTYSRPHHAEMSTGVAGAHAQDPEILVTGAQGLIHTLTQEFGPFYGVGVTGQMHGILYVDAAGKAVSPVYTWLDRQAEEKDGQGKSCLERFQNATGEAVPSGYGAVTHFTQVQHGRVPETATSLCTAPDYLVMRLCSLKHPLTDPTLAHSLGLFDLEQLSFKSAWARLGESRVQLPHVSVSGVVAGEYEGVPVITALGDNQASFVGSISDPEHSVLLTLGTSGQVSCVSNELKYADGLETRPFPGNRFLLVGASLTGGKALEMLAKLVDEIAYKLTGEHLGDPYKLLEVNPGKLKPPCLEVDTRFAGSRSSTGAKAGAIGNITTDNFTLEHLTYGFTQGVVTELHTFWSEGFTAAGVTAGTTNVIGSGNALRRSALVRELVQETFALPLTLTSHQEEGAVGAAIYAASVVQKSPLETLSKGILEGTR